MFQALAPALIPPLIDAFKKVVAKKAPNELKEVIERIDLADIEKDPELQKALLRAVLSTKNLNNETLRDIF